MIQTDDEIFHEMQTELRKVHALGVAIDMDSVGVTRLPGSRTWVRFEKGNPMDVCSVCAIGADLLGSQVSGQNDYEAFANKHGRSNKWGQGYMNGSAPDEDPKFPFRPTVERYGQDYYDGFWQGCRIYNWVMDQKAKGKL